MKILPLAVALTLAIAPASFAKDQGPKDTSPGNSGEHKVVICHHAGPTKTITITVDGSAQVKHHQNHGDTVGPCPTSQPPVDPPVDPPVNPPVTPPTDTPVETPDTTVVGPQTPAETPQDGSLVAGDKVAAEKKRAAKRRAEKRAERTVAPRAARRAQNARVAGGDELPFTGIPVAIIALAGLALGGTGVALRKYL